MRKLFVSVVLLVATALFSFGSPALADGATTFTAKCAMCHVNGGNIFNSQKTLSKADLDANSKYSIEAIITQVTNGQSPMPAFKYTLSEDEIAEVAAYVYGKATTGW